MARAWDVKFNTPPDDFADESTSAGSRLWLRAKRLRAPAEISLF
jgi:hypothetical protein